MENLILPSTLFTEFGFTSTAPVTEPGSTSVVEPVETEDAAIENLFTEPISIVVPMDSTAKDSTTPTTFDVLPANASLEQLQVAAKSLKATGTPSRVQA